MEEERLKELYKASIGKDVVRIEQIHGSGGGGRKYYRITDIDGNTLFGIKGTNAEENEAFYNLSLLFAQREFNTPMVYGISDDRMCYLQQDLGTTTLADFLKTHKSEDGGYDAEAREMLEKVISLLPQMQFGAANEEVFKECYPVPEMDRMSVEFDLNYFKYCFLKLKGIEFNEVRLENDFTLLANDILSEMTETFMYRDFQARNVMIFNDTPYFIDYQGGRKGPIYYDVASFVWQASVNYPDELKDRLIDTYIRSLRVQGFKMSKDDFLPRLYKMLLFRTLQVLGAYGFRGLWEKKQQFIDSIPQGLKNLQWLIDNHILDSYPELLHVSTQLTATLNNSQSAHGFRVMSFSYRKGMPEDRSGNGGGYVFDCRSSHNPGRYEEYKHLTGLDEPVIQFLETDGEITTFLESVYKIVDFHVKRYLERGFRDLMICFGCTGGQHRSVYCAQHVAEHICEKFAVEVQLTHREQNINTILKPAESPDPLNP